MDHTPAITHYLKAVNHVFRRRGVEKLHPFQFEILHTVLALPARFLHTPVFSPTAFDKKMSGLYFVFSLLLQESYLNSRESTKELAAIVTAAAAKVTEVDLADILQRMELVTESLSRSVGLDNVASCWQALCRHLAGLEELGETKGTSKTFGCVLQFLRYPLQFLGEQDPRFWRAWGALYAAVATQGEMTMGFESGKICAEMTEGIVTVFNALPADQRHKKLMSQARCVQILTENILFDPIARESKQRQEKLTFFKQHLSQPLGNATRCVQHLNQLCEMSLKQPDNMDSEVVDVILTTYTNLLARLDQQGWKLLIFSHGQELGQQASWLNKNERPIRSCRTAS